MSTIEPVNPLAVPSGNLRRRKRVDRLMRGTSTAAAVFAVAVLAIVIFSVLGKGASQLSISFLTKDPAVGLSAVGRRHRQRDRRQRADRRRGDRDGVAHRRADRALPDRVLQAAHGTADPARARPAQRHALDRDRLCSCTGCSSSAHQQTGFAASFALAIIMVPLIARTTRRDAACSCPGNCATPPMRLASAAGARSSASSCPARSAASSPAPCWPSLARPARLPRCCCLELDLRQRHDRRRLRRRAAEHPDDDLQRLRIGRSVRPRAGLGRGPRPDRVHPCGQPGCAGHAGAPAAKDPVSR